MKPTKKQRAGAVLWLRCEASNWRGPSYGTLEPNLVYSVKRKLNEMGYGMSIPWAEYYAEAAQLLEDGWCPGDEVVVV